MHAPLALLAAEQGHDTVEDAVLVVGDWGVDNSGPIDSVAANGSSEFEGDWLGQLGEPGGGGLGLDAADLLLEAGWQHVGPWLAMDDESKGQPRGRARTRAGAPGRQAREVGGHRFGGDVSGDQNVAKSCGFILYLHTPVTFCI